MSDKVELLQGTLDLIVLRALSTMGPQHAYGLAARLEQEAFKIAAELSTRARSTIVASKAMLLRLRDHRRPPAGAADDIIRECYGSDEFKEGVAAFLDGRRPNFT